MVQIVVATDDNEVTSTCFSHGGLPLPSQYFVEEILDVSAASMHLVLSHVTCCPVTLLLMLCSTLPQPAKVVWLGQHAKGGSRHPGFRVQLDCLALAAFDQEKHI